MPIVREEKTDNYTVMCNYHLRDTKLSMKARGLLSVVLSLPDDWDFSLAGLAVISKEGKDSLRTALKELEDNGYLVRVRKRNRGLIADMEYTFFEKPKQGH